MNISVLIKFEGVCGKFGHSILYHFKIQVNSCVDISIFSTFIFSTYIKFEKKENNIIFLGGVKLKNEVNLFQF